jgi:hypothetical protein
MRKKYGSDALEWMYDEFIGNDPERVAVYGEERIKAGIARQVYDIRVQASLTQKQLADIVGTTETVVDDLEEADYEGDALSMLILIATALRKRINIRFVTSEQSDSVV